MGEHAEPGGRLADLLSNRPHALIAAVGGDGLFVDLPPTLPVDGHRVVEALSATEIVEPQDRERVIAAWDQVLAEGGASTQVALPGADEPATMHLFDERDDHGVLVMVLDAGEDPPPVGPVGGPSTEGIAKVVRVRKSNVAVIEDVDDAVTQVLGWQPEELIGLRSLDLIHPEDHGLAITAWMDMLSDRGMTTRARLRHQRADGGWTWMDISNHNGLDGAGGGVDCEMVDVTDEVQAQEALQASEQLLRRLTEALPVGVFHIDADQRLRLANPRLHEILGTTPEDAQTTLRERVSDRLAFDRAIDAVLAGTDVDMELDVRPLGSGELRRCTLALRTLGTDHDHITGALGCVTDVTDSVRLREELERRASIDELTGCYNRARVLEALDQALAKGADVSVVFVDIDLFKRVNDEHGHAAGDEVLQAVAARLRASVRGHDAVGRMGGDEFLAVCPGVSGAGWADEVRERIASTLGDPVAFAGRRIEISASVGVAWTAAGEPVDADALVARADADMYARKSARRG